VTTIVVVVVLWLNGGIAIAEVEHSGNLTSCRTPSNMARAMDEAQVATGGWPLRAYCNRKDII
jgi:hypothetical protein